MIEDVSVLVNADVSIDQPEFAIFHQSVGVFEVGAPGTNGLDFSTAQSNAGLKFLQQKVVVGGGTIDRSITQAAGRRIAPALLFLFRTTCRLWRTGHGEKAHTSANLVC